MDAGGHVIVSGSEVGYALNADPFLATLGARFVGDDAGSLKVDGEGPLASLSNVAFGGDAAVYAEDYPDILGVAAGSGGVALLRYDTGAVAAVGVAGRGALVGFPLEVVESPSEMASLLHALVTFTTGP